MITLYRDALLSLPGTICLDGHCDRTGQPLTGRTNRGAVLNHSPTPNCKLVQATLEGHRRLFLETITTVPIGAELHWNYDIKPPKDAPTWMTK